MPESASAAATAGIQAPGGSINVNKPNQMIWYVAIVVVIVCGVVVVKWRRK